MSTSLSIVFLLPRNVLVAIVRIYRAAISPFYGDVCRYYPSCSAYALRAIQQRGAISGGRLAIFRVGRCHPWSRGGIEDVPMKSSSNYPVTRFGFVIPKTQRKA